LGILDDDFSFTSLEALAKDKALSMIQDFNNQFNWFKKLANAQDPYRFLKDADIEKLPWDAPKTPGLITDPWLFEDFVQALDRI